jgi:hypothetical protein
MKKTIHNNKLPNSQIEIIHFQVKKLGLHSRLWVLAACTLIATPFASMVLYLDVSNISIWF